MTCLIVKWQLIFTSYNCTRCSFHVVKTKQLIYAKGDKANTEHRIVFVLNCNKNNHRHMVTSMPKNKQSSTPKNKIRNEQDLLAFNTSLILSAGETTPCCTIFWIAFSFSISDAGFPPAEDAETTERCGSAFSPPQTLLHPSAVSEHASASRSDTVGLDSGPRPPLRIKPLYET